MFFTLVTLWPTEYCPQGTECNEFTRRGSASCGVTFLDQEVMFFMVLYHKDSINILMSKPQSDNQETVPERASGKEPQASK